MGRTRLHRRRQPDLTPRTSVRYNGSTMPIRAFELQLPLDDGAAGALARRRIEHLRTAVSGLDTAAFSSLARAFPSLGAIYAAGEAELAGVIGPVAAARVRWFLDAPLDTRLLTAAEEHPTVRAA